MKDKLARARTNLMVFGAWDTLRHLVAGTARTEWDGFDAAHGTETSSVHLDRADSAPAPGHLARSISTDPRLLNHILRNVDIDHGEFTFVDFGCGKGRALLAASDFPFSRIVGVEWSADLCTTAERNLDVYSSPNQRCTNLEVHCMDVLDFELPIESTLLYLFNPFGTELYVKVFSRIRKSVMANPRPFLVILSGIGRREEVDTTKFMDKFGLGVLQECRTLHVGGSWVVAAVR